MSCRVMVVDDDPMIRFLVQEYLTAVGYSVIACESGAKALESLQSEIPALIVLDLQMPEMNGIQVLSHVRGNEATKGVPVLMLSANAADARNDTSVIADRYLEKPFQMSELLEAVKSTARTDQ